VSGTGPALAGYGYVPAGPELALVRAALGPAPPDGAALELAAAAAAGRANQGVERLLPLFRGRPGLPPALAEAVERRYRESLVAFLASEERLLPVLRELRRRRVPALLLKGHPLARRFYASPGHRPMADIDLAVRPGQAREAVEALGAAGLARPAGRHLALGPGVHAAPFEGDGVKLDLHVHVLFCSRWAGADDGFWARAVPCPVRGEEALTLAPADHVLHACLHGYGRGPHVSPVRWLVDAVTVMRRSPLGDEGWAALVAEAGRQRCEGVLAAALGFLARELEALVPPEVVEGLAAAPRAVADDRYFRAFGRLTADLTLRRKAGLILLDHRRQRGRGVVAPLDLLRWMGERWGARSTAAVLAEALRRARPGGGAA
jgi:hypothetical protein